MKGRAIEDRFTRWDRETGKRVPAPLPHTGARWVARFVMADGREVKRRFDTRAKASAWLDEQSAGFVRGDFVDTRRGRVPFDEWASLWLASKADLKPSTLTRYEGIVRVHLIPAFGSRPIGDITHGEVAALVASLLAGGERRRALSASSVRQAHRALSLILAFAVRDGRLARNVAEGVPQPRAAKPDKRYLTLEELRRLASCASDEQAHLILMILGLTGLRFGELAALRVKRVDLLRRRIEIAESASEIGGVLTFGTPKTHQRRSVPIPRSLADALAVQVAGKGPDEIVFTTSAGTPIGLMNWRHRTFDPAVKAAGLDGLTPHELRHTAASLAVASGAGPKAVQRMLGHASAAMTLDVYSGLFDDELESLADRLDEVLASAGPTTAPVVALPG